MTQSHGRSHSLRWLVAAAPAFLAIVSAVTTFGCTSCTGPSRRYNLIPIGATSRTIDAPISMGTNSYRWHCWGTATGPRVDAWTYGIVWRISGTSAAVGDVAFVSVKPTLDAGLELDRACDSQACPIVDVGTYSLHCAADGLCVVPTQLDFEIRVDNPSVVPTAGLRSEFVITAGFFSQTTSGGGGFNLIQPVGADVSDVTLDVGCVQVAP